MQPTQTHFTESASQFLARAREIQGEGGEPVRSARAQKLGARSAPPRGHLLGQDIFSWNQTFRVETYFFLVENMVILEEYNKSSQNNSSSEQSARMSQYLSNSPYVQPLPLEVRKMTTF